MLFSCFVQPTLFSLLVQLTLFYGLLVHAQAPLQLGNIPLAVKTPYLQAWLGGNWGQSPPRKWPNFVSDNRELKWAGIIRVDNQAYQWMGEGGPNFATTLASEITPTKSIFRLAAGPIQFNATFLSPIEPNDYVRQSMPFSYMYIDGIAANDSQPHTVQVYSDISAEWASKEDTAPVTWSTMETSNMIYHRVTRQKPSLMMENGGVAEDATAYYVMEKRSGLTWRTGADADCRGSFASSGTLTNSGDTTFRSVSENWPVFAFSVDLGTISPGNQVDPVFWTVGLVRDPLVTFTIVGHAQDRSAYYWSKYSTIEEVMSAFLSDFPSALTRSLALDNKILSAASATSPEYASILSVVTRQIFASMDITIPSAKPGQFKTSDVNIFMKDIGQSQRTNPVEVIYSALPALLFFNPLLARDLLQPLLGSQSSSQYPNSYASPDLGAGYPLVHDNSTDTHTLAVESCGDMLIMVYAYTTKSGDSAFLSRYYSLLQRWADFLLENSLHPSGFITADGLNSPDMSNLALKGILGVYSMAKINEAMGVPNTTYMDQATQLIKDWKQSAIAADGHIKVVYEQADSWGLMYNLFPAVWLKTGLIEDSVLVNQAQFYSQQNSPDFGFGLDSSRSNMAYPHWTLMTAAIIPDSWNTVQNKLIKSTYQRANMQTTDAPLPPAYQPSNGDALSGNGSPILGAAFAVLAMHLPNIDITSSPTSASGSPSSSSFSSSPSDSPAGSHSRSSSSPPRSPPSSSPSNPPPSSPSPSPPPSPSPSTSRPTSPPGPHTKDSVRSIVGGVLGGLAFLFMATAIFIFWRKHKQRQAEPEATPFTTTQLLLPPGVDKSSISPLTRAALPKRPRRRRAALDSSRWRIPTQSGSPLPTLPDLDPAPTPAAIPTPTPTPDVRAELEQLRREMESIRRITDAPPRYS